MADAKLSGLTAITTVTTDDLFYVVDDPAGTPTSKKITAANLKAYIINPITMPVIDPSGAGYAIQQNLNTFESGLYSDATFNFGYNVAAVPGTKVVATEPLLFFQMESKYRQNPSSPYGSEFHLNFAKPTDPSAPSLTRPINIFMEHITGLVQTTFIADDFRITTSANVATLEYTANSWYFRRPMLLSPLSGAASFTVEAPTHATFLLNATNINTIQFNRAGVTKWSLYDAGSNNLYLRNLQDARMHIQFSPGATNALSFTDFSSNIRLGDASDIIFNTTTGTKIGTATNQKLAFWNTTPVVQPVFATGAVHTVDELVTVLQSLGLMRQS